MKVTVGPTPAPQRGRTGGSSAPPRKRGFAFPGPWYPRSVAKQTITVDDVVSAVETARDKVMTDEVKQLVKLGLPKSHAVKMVAERYRQRDEGETTETENSSGNWVDIS